MSSPGEVFQSSALTDAVAHAANTCHGVNGNPEQRYNKTSGNRVVPRKQPFVYRHNFQKEGGWLVPPVTSITSVPSEITARYSSTGPENTANSTHTVPLMVAIAETWSSGVTSRERMLQCLNSPFYTF